MTARYQIEAEMDDEPIYVTKHNEEAVTIAAHVPREAAMKIAKYAAEILNTNNQ